MEASFQFCLSSVFALKSFQSKDFEIFYMILKLKNILYDIFSIFKYIISPLRRDMFDLWKVFFSFCILKIILNKRKKKF